MNETINRPRRRLGRTVAAGLGLSLAIAAQAAPAGADGAETFHYGFKGQTAEARFYSQQGCTGTEVYVHAVDGRVKVGAGRPDAQSTLFVGVLRFDVCTQQVLGRSLGFSEDLGDALDFDRRRRRDALVPVVSLANRLRAKVRASESVTSLCWARSWRLRSTRRRSASAASQCERATHSPRPVGPDLGVQSLVLHGQAGGRAHGVEQPRLLPQRGAVHQRSDPLVGPGDHCHRPVGIVDRQLDPPPVGVDVALQSPHRVDDLDARIAQGTGQRRAQLPADDGSQLHHQLAHPVSRQSAMADVSARCRPAHLCDPWRRRRQARRLRQ